MRTKVLNYSILFLLAFLVQTGSFAQNPFWTLPNQYLFFDMMPPQPLPTPTPFPGPNQGDLTYNGDSAEYAHNAIASVTGELEFFIVDGMIYDREGYLIAKMSTNEGAPGGGPYPVKGNSEVCIVPDPGNCWRYYIFSNRSHDQFPIGAYTVLDVSLENTAFGPGEEYEDRYGGLLFGDWDDPDNCENILNLDLPNGSGGTVQLTDNQDMFYAATKLNSNNERFVFVQMGDGIWKLIIDENGIYADPSDPIYVSDIFPSFPGASSGYLRQELEVVELNNGNYRIGLVYPAGDSQNSHVVSVLELDDNGNYITNSAFMYPLASAGSNPALVKGLEFSENGQYLYFTHHEVSTAQPAVQYIDYDLQQVFDLNVPNRTDYQYSQIEMGLDGKLYFAHENGLATLDSADTPNIVNWNPSTYAFSNSPSYTSYTGQIDSKVYTLPDQIDGMDYSIYPFYPYNTVSVSNTEIWTPEDNPLSNDTSLVRIEEELRIESGAHITIKNMRFEFFEDARVVIEPGARLTMDSTTFTVGPCHDKMWLGVEVHGDPEASQLPVSNQGYLHMKNNSVIEHAYIGALAASRYYWTGQVSSVSTGGIIRAFNSRFRNNMTDVWIHDYDWPGLPNHCHFINCDFLTDGLLNDPEVFPSNHAYLRSVNDVRFMNCSFRNTASFADLPIENRGKGLYSHHATFRVIGDNEVYEAAHDTLPISDNVHQSFYRLRYGAKVVGQPNHHFTVSKMEFQDNKMGIYVLGASYETITLNNFKVPEIDDNYPGFNYGAYLINSYLFTIEENNFFGGPELTRIAGLVIDNSCPDDAEGDKNIELENEVYRNQFTDLEIGILVENDNRDQNSEVGLQARCNQFSNNYSADIFLADYSEWRKNQGELSPPEAASNNLFSQSTFNCAGLYSDVKVSPLYGANQSPNSLTIDYRTLETPAATQPYKHYDNPISGCQEQKLWLVESPGDLDYETHCPSNFSSTGGIKVPLAQLEQELATAEANLESARAVYQATIDGGDTEDIIALLQNLLNEESAYLRDLLLANYPLSRKALMAALDAADSFDPWHLTQVLVANAPLPGDVYSFVKDNQLLSPFFFQFVEDAQANGGVNLGRLLYSEISLRSYEKSQAERAIKRHYLHHADSIDAAAWNTYLESRDEPYYRLYRLGAHLDKGETGAAQTMLDSLKLNDASEDWFQFMIDLEVADTVTATDISSGWDFFYNAPAARGNVWGWLTAQGQLDSIPPLPPVAQPRSFSLMSDEETAKVDRWLEAYPNPAKDRVVLTYPQEADGIGTVQLFNADGRLMKTFAASDNGFEEINLTGWPTGVYIAKLFVNDKPIDTVKINVVK